MAPSSDSSFIKALLAIVGATASGKSQLAMKLAQRFDGEIIAADSRTVYRYADIGTAKPRNEEMLQIPHHLIDVVNPDEPFTAPQFQRLALAAIEEIGQRGRVPILVGGSGLYIDSVLYDYRFPDKADPKMRRELEALSDAELVARLGALDPTSAERVDLANRRRMIRAIETAGLPVGRRGELRPATLVLGIALNKELLQKRIQARVEKMLAQGLIAEVEHLGGTYGWDAAVMNGPAYRAFRGVVEGSKTIAEASSDFTRADIQLAKKQLTWFKRNSAIKWLDGADSQQLLAEASNLVADFLAG